MRDSASLPESRLWSAAPAGAFGHGELCFEEENTLHLAGLPIVGTLDRVDVHEETANTEFSITRLPPNVSRPRAALRFQPWKAGKWFGGATCSCLCIGRSRSSAGPASRFRQSSDISCCPNEIEESGIDELILDEALFASAKAAPRAWPNGSVAESFGLLARPSSTTLPVSFLAKIQRKQLAKNPKNS